MVGCHTKGHIHFSKRFRKHSTPVEIFGSIENPGTAYHGAELNLPDLTERAIPIRALSASQPKTG